jgi:hypothetical protein
MGLTIFCGVAEKRMGILRVSVRRNLKSYCEKDEGIDCEDGDSDTDW